MSTQRHYILRCDWVESVVCTVDCENCSAGIWTYLLTVECRCQTCNQLLSWTC